MEKKDGPAEPFSNAKHPPRPASAMHTDKLHLADLDNAHMPPLASATRPASAPASVSSLTSASPPGAHTEGEIQLAEADPKPKPKPKPDQPNLHLATSQIAMPSPSLHKNLMYVREPWEIDTSKITLRNVIGRGAYGCVYRGFYEEQEVAVKILDWGEEATMQKFEVDSIRRSYIQEATVWHKLSHPNITKFVGAFIGDTRIKTSGTGKDVYVTSSVGCVVEEFLCGGSLRAYLMGHHDEKLSFELAMRFARDLAKGLSYLHSQTIVHRDVKTDNMLLDNYMNVKIADFGIARVEAKNPRDMTGESGTLHYMAPEVIEGKPYNRTCDVYSFGVCLWEIYCCDEPYKHIGLKKYMSDVVKKNVRPPIPRCCPDDLASIMKKCWDPDREKRPDMADVVIMLQKIDTSKGSGMKSSNQPKGCFCFA